MPLPSSPGCRPSAPRWSTASTGVALRSSPSTDLRTDQLKSPGIARGFFASRLMTTSPAAEAYPLPLPHGNDQATLALVVLRRRPITGQGNVHAQIAFDRGISCPRHWTALDRPGHRGDRLAAIELHDRTASGGGLWRHAGRGRPDPDLAR